MSTPSNPIDPDEGLTGFTSEPFEEAPSEIEDNLEIHQVKSRAVRATTGLLGRQVIVRGLDFGGMIILAKVLTPAMFGVFAIARFVVYFFQRFSDFGLSATLLRKAEAVTEPELRTVFTIQNTVVALSMVVIMVGAPLVVSHYEDLQPEHVWLIRTLALGLFLASLKTIPSILIQRNLRHERLAVVDVVEVIVYQGVTVAMAVMGYGVWSLVWGTLARGVIGVALVYRIAWWRPAFGFSRTAAKEIAEFGVPIQLGSFITLARDAVVPVMVGTILGVSAVGFVNWARTMMGAAVGQPLNLMGKVQMRVFGRIQKEEARLQRAIERNIFLGSSAVGLTLALLVALAEPFVLYIIEPKWLPALPVLYLFGVAFATNIVSNPYVQALKALGEGWTTFWNQILNAGGLISVFCALHFGFGVGIVAFGWGFIASQVLVAFHAAHRLHKYVRPHWWRAMWPGVAAGLLSSAAAVAVSRGLPSLFGMVVAGGVGSVVYLFVLGVIAGDRLSEDVHDVGMSLAGRSARARRIIELIQTIFQSLHFRSRLSTHA